MKKTLSHDDHRQRACAILVLDNRILAKQYGQAFLDALPECPMEVI